MTSRGRAGDDSASHRMLFLWDRWIAARSSDLMAFAESVDGDESFVLTVCVTRDAVMATTVGTASSRPSMSRRDA